MNQLPISTLLYQNIHAINCAEEVETSHLGVNRAQRWPKGICADNSLHCIN